jgi:hypothetical protein
MDFIIINLLLLIYHLSLLISYHNVSMTIFNKMNVFWYIFNDDFINSHLTNEKFVIYQLLNLFIYLFIYNYMVTLSKYITVRGKVSPDYAFE